jgi:hypothetical protein
MIDNDEIIKNQFVRRFIDLTGLKSGCGYKLNFSSYFDLTEEFTVFPRRIQTAALLDLLILLCKKES